ncbi:zinc finger protein, putative [Ricinus communis]|uniref:RBR-type E3 ubiquitin transferase n=1 Tax=Ricinus communis TaxID=3988 RepID=B9SWE5_RICCO|nr:zinc finger protein, putative [Ricinus communis]
MKRIKNFTCEICIEPTLSNRKFKNGNGCTHPFCNDCIAKYVEVKVIDNVANIKCPSLGCDRPLEPTSCMALIPKAIFDKWSDLLCEVRVLEWERCYCPYENCSALILNECRYHKVKKVTCPNCKKNFCFNCKIPWHGGYWCRESRQLRDGNDVLAGELIENQRWTRCYNCGHSVERVDGCKFISCRCGVEFCHECGYRAHCGPCSLEKRAVCA